MKHRPIGIGIQGLADLFLLMKIPFESEESQMMNIKVFETIYYGALEASCELSEKYGPYETYEGSPVSQGVSLLFIFINNANSLVSEELYKLLCIFFFFRFFSMICGM